MNPVALIFRFSLSVRILAWPGPARAFLTGLFFGESAAVLHSIADIHIKLVQMMVLPT